MTSPPAEEADADAVRAVVATFFDAFTSGPGLDERLDRLRAVLHPRAVVVRTCGLPVEVMDVDAFVEPRRELLAGTRLTGFREWPVDGSVEVFGDAAQWCGTYAKEWVEGGERRTGRGAKSLHLARTPGGWLVTAAIWDDERPGFVLPD